MRKPRASDPPAKLAPRDLRIDLGQNLDALALVSVADRRTVSARWRKVVPAEWADLLDAPVIEDA